MLLPHGFYPSPSQHICMHLQKYTKAVVLAAHIHDACLKHTSSTLDGRYMHADDIVSVATVGDVVLVHYVCKTLEDQVQGLEGGGGGGCEYSGKECLAHASGISACSLGLNPHALSLHTTCTAMNA